MHLFEHIMSLEEKLLEPLVRQSRSNLDELLADEFIEFSSSGLTLNKKQIINALSEEVDVHFTLKNFKVTHLSDEVILANYLAIKNEEVFSLRSSIWKCSKGRWQLFFHQGTNCSSESRLGSQ